MPNANCFLNFSNFYVIVMKTNEVMDRNERAVMSYNLKMLCRLCGKIEETTVVSIYDDEGENDFSSRKICYSCASGKIVWNDSYLNPNETEQNLRSKQFDANPSKNEPFSVFGTDVPVNDCIGGLMGHEEISEVQTFNTNTNLDETSNRWDKIPSISETNTILNRAHESSVIEDGERSNIALESELPDLFNEMVNFEDNRYLYLDHAASNIDDDIIINRPMNFEAAVMDECSDGSSTVTSDSNGADDVRFEQVNVDGITMVSSGNRSLLAPAYEENLCPVCHEKFQSQYKMLHHVKKRHRECKILGCDLCRTYFRSIEALKDHVEKNHSKAVAANLSRMRFVCNVCGILYKNKSNVMNHQLTHATVKTVHCSVCDFSCYIKQQLKVHVNTHNKPFACDICQKVFAQRAQLNVHMNGVHYNRRPYPCSSCKKEFKTKSAYDVHKIFHSGVRNYECPQCDKKFWKNYDLKIHMRTHTGERPFKCNACNFSFKQIGDLRKHGKLHENRTNRSVIISSSQTTNRSGDMACDPSTIIASNKNNKDMS